MKSLLSVADVGQYVCVVSLLLSQTLDRVGGATQIHVSKCLYQHSPFAACCLHYSVHHQCQFHLSIMVVLLNGVQVPLHRWRLMPI